ncbi:MAG: Gfo/Idh/MocA family oxidoreductase [Rhodothermales bacterium]|nr:Gfo/Idh/MocA family oxidoreductase [Rhodothermales bacterium]
MQPRAGLGIVGLNFGANVIETQLLGGPAEPWFELRAVCDADAARARAAGERYGVPAYSSLGDLLADDTIRAVGLFTGPAGRAGLLGQIIRAGRDVMTTKPFERDPEAAAAVLREAVALGRTIHLNSPGPFLEPDLRRIKQLEATHDLGRPVALRWETWCNYREQADGSWYDDPERCPAAPLFRLGIYAINEFVQLMAGRAEPESVQVVTSRLFTGRPTADNAMLILRFTDGTLGSIFASFCIDDGAAYPDTLTVGYERGTIVRKDLPFAAGEPQRKSVQLHTGPRAYPPYYPRHLPQTRWRHVPVGGLLPGDARPGRAGRNAPRSDRRRHPHRQRDGSGGKRGKGKREKGKGKREKV